MNPRQVTLNVWNACNFRCTYCAVGSNRSADPRADSVMDDIPRALDRLRAEGYGIVVFSGGEPTLHPGLPAWIAHARDLGFVQRTIITNASRLGDAALVRALVAAGLTHVNVSFHTCREEVFDELADVPGAYQKVVTGIRTLVEANEQLGRPLFVHANLLLMRPTLADAGATVDFLADLGIPVVTVEIVRAKGGALERAEELQCSMREVRAALSQATAAARRRGVSLNTADIPGCCLESPADVDVESYVVRREKQVHWVVSERSEGALNRESHVKAPGCRACAVEAWCSGFERCLVQVGEEGALALGDGAPLPPALDAGALLRCAAQALVDRPGEAAARGRALELLSLLSPPTAATVTSWLSLLETHAHALLAFDADDPQQASAVLGFFPMPRSPGSELDWRPGLQQLARRERVIEERLAAVAQALGPPPPAPPPCCREAAEADQRGGGPGALFWLHAVVRGERSPLLNTAGLPWLAPFVTCRPGCAAAAAVGAARLEALAPDARAAATRLLETPCLALGPFVRIFLKGEAAGETSVRYDPSSLLCLTEPALDRDLRRRLLTAVARLVVPALQDGDLLEDQADALVVRRGERDIARLTRRLRWTRSLLVPVAGPSPSQVSRAP